MAGSIVGALAQDMNWLIFARALQVWVVVA